MLKDLPKWFLAVVLTAVIAIVPSWVHLNTRITLLEQSHYETRKERERFVQVLDKMDDNMRGLAEAIVELRTEMKNLKKQQ
ncbi:MULTISPECIES: hypothetical protein [unclassified Marinobacter]|uniref:hypothetical protein n=1 Tax=unclassified Marinobacter TaxID=83889 RepID=UPI001268C31A|nr:MULTISPECIES: hypothetical protein [unclassified Marinobacter]QFS87584.1 hypothetical protein FIV08_12195 [Marinobacter sp. THAF197a]QFT51369.1 hypothetical protein FIU96_12110 [Marinobacter sp. THAF39]